MENSRNLTATSEAKGAKRTPLNRFRLLASAVVIRPAKRSSASSSGGCGPRASCRTSEIRST